MKKYTYNFRTNTSDFFWYREGNIYYSWTGVINVIFTIAFIALQISRWNSTSVPAKVLIFIAMAIFPIIQPITVYFASRGDAKKVKYDTHMDIDDEGIHIQVESHKQNIHWQKIRGVVKRRKMIIIAVDETHAYLLTNRIVKEDKDELYSFILDHCDENVRGNRV